MDKQSLRKEYISKRETLTPEIRKEYSAAICKYCMELQDFKNANIVAAYNAFGSEADLSELVFESNKTIVLPLCREDGTLEFKLVKNKNELEKGKYRGLMEPKRNLPTVLPKEIDLIFVPGVVFDVRGYRIGYGKGYYDRALSEISPECKVYGVSYSMQIINAIKNEEYDKKVEKIITEKGVYGCIGGEYI